MNKINGIILPIVAMLAVGCVALDDEDRVATLSPKQVAKLCKELGGDHVCGGPEGAEIRYTASADECEESVSTRYQPCSMTVGEFRECVDAIRECTDGFPSPIFVDGVCDAFIECETRDLP